MTRVRVVLLVLAALVLAPVPMVVTATPAHACSCQEMTSDEVWDSADVIVVGTVTDRQGDPEGIDDLTYEIAVSSIYTGTTSSTLTFAAPVDSAACGLTFDVGDPEQVFVLHEDEGDLMTNVCTMSQVTPVPDDYVGTDQPPATTGADDDTGTDATGAQSWAPLWIGLGLGVVVLAGLWLVLRRPLR